MNRFTLRLACVCATLMTQHALAADIVISDEQISELGISFATPSRSTEGSALMATAQVVIPPAGQFAVSTLESGVVLRLHANVGDRVESGQLMAELQSPGFITAQREFLDSHSNARLMATQLERDLQLFDEGIISRRRLQETQMQANVARTRQDEYRQLLELGGLAAEQIETLAQERKLIDVMSIRAPFAGVVLNLMTMSGERLEAMAPLYRIADLSSLWLDIHVSGEVARQVRPGMQVMIDGPATAPPAVVRSIGQARDDHTQTVIVRAELPDGEGQLQPGQFVSVRIVGESESPDNQWSLPASAIIHEGQQQIIFVRTAQGFDRLVVELLAMDGDRAHVAAPLSAVSEVAASGVVALKALSAGDEESAN